MNHLVRSSLALLLLAACSADEPITCGPGTVDSDGTCVLDDAPSGGSGGKAGAAGKSGASGKAGSAGSGQAGAEQSGGSGQAGSSGQSGSSGQAGAGQSGSSGQAGSAGSGQAGGAGGAASGASGAAGGGQGGAGQAGSAQGGGSGAGPTVVCAQAKENEAASLSCPEGQVITAVTFASYGTPQGVCGSLAQGACHAAGSQQQVEQACLGKPSCAVSATNAAFGDPCENTVKGLSVEASCGPGSGGAGGVAGQGGAGGGGSSGSSGQAGAGGGGSSGASGQGGAPDCPCFECPGTPPPPSQTFDEGELLVTHQGTPITAHYFEGILYATATWPGMTCDSPGCFVPGSPGLCDLLSSNGYPAKDDCQSFAMEDPRKGWKPPVYQAKTYCDGEIIGGCDYPVQVRVKDEKGYIRLLKPDETVWSVDGGYMVNTNCGLPFHWRCFLNGVGTDEQLGLGAPCLP